MLNQKRVWCVGDVQDAEELAQKLGVTWTLCAGFRLGNYLFLNDSISEDGAQEYAIVRDGKQIESYTFGWMDAERRLKAIQEILSGRFDDCDYGTVHPSQIQTPDEHGQCYLCR